MSQILETLNQKKENYKDQIEELKTVIKKGKEATKKDVGNLQTCTKRGSW